MSHLLRSRSHICWDWESGTHSCVTSGGPSASLGFRFFILSLQSHRKPDSCCQDFEKLQNGDEEEATGLGDRVHQGRRPAQQGLLSVPWVGAFVPSWRSGCHGVARACFSRQEVGLPLAISLSLWEDVPPWCTLGASLVTLRFPCPRGPADKQCLQGDAAPRPHLPAQALHLLPPVAQATAALSPRTTRSGKRITHTKPNQSPQLPGEA